MDKPHTLDSCRVGAVYCDETGRIMAGIDILRTRAVGLWERVHWTRAGWTACPERCRRDCVVCNAGAFLI